MAAIAGQNCGGCLSMGNVNYVFGDKEVIQAMKKLPDKMRENVLNTSIRAGAKVVQEEVVKRAPTDSGKYRDAIVIKKINKSLKRRGFIGQFFVGVTWPQSSLTHLLEWGFYSVRAQRFIPGKAFWRAALNEERKVYDAIHKAATRAFKRNAKKLTGSAAKSGLVRRKSLVGKAVRRG